MKPCVWRAVGSGEEGMWWRGLRREAAGRAGTGLAHDVSKGVPNFYNKLLIICCTHNSCPSLLKIQKVK